MHARVRFGRRPLFWADLKVSGTRRADSPRDSLHYDYDLIKYDEKVTIED